MWLTLILFSQFLAALNQTCIATHNLVERGEVYETKFLKAIEELKKSEELRWKLGEEAKVASGAKATLENGLTKLKVENTELQSQLQGSQEDLQTVQCNYATLSGKVIGVEKQVKAPKDKLHETIESEAASKEVAVLEAKQ